jgi:Ca2+-binding EF-hand superfamily protein
MNLEDDKISFSQFKDYFGGTYFGRYTKLELIYVFNLLDKDMDAEIGYNDLVALFSPIGWVEKLEIDKILNAMDYNKDGRVCFEGR